MSAPKVPLFLSARLIELLSEKSLTEQDYMPAYEGESACLDLYFVGSERCTIYPQGTCVIPTGINIALPLGSVALVEERGSITKTPLVKRAGVIDPGYTGEIFVSMFNFSSSESFSFEPGDKLPLQLLILNGTLSPSPITNYDEYKSLTAGSKRLEGKIGSSN